jgi:hypothetical protein
MQELIQMTYFFQGAIAFATAFSIIFAAPGYLEKKSSQMKKPTEKTAVVILKDDAEDVISELKDKGYEVITVPFP